MPTADGGSRHAYARPVSAAVQESRLAVVGIGYAGLPLAVAAAAHGYRTCGLDISSQVVDQVRSGISPVDTVSAGELRSVRDRFEATDDPGRLTDCSVIVVCVPTPLDAQGRPDLGPLTSAARTVRDHLRAGQLVVVESTTYPGTTDSVIKPILEQSGLRAGLDFNLAFSSERVDPGNPQYQLHNTPKVVGGLTPVCSARAKAFYSGLVQQVYLTRGMREAEASKILENTFRQVNIALVNEFAQLCHELGIDIWDTIQAAETKPFGFTGFRPSAGVGGHCIPVDPMYFVHCVRELGLSFRMAESAHSVNSGMPQWIAQRVRKILADTYTAARGRAQVLLLGITYKKDIADVRNSPAKEVARLLIAEGIRVSFHDPYVTELAVDGKRMVCVSDVDQAVRAADLVVIAQRHKDYGDDLLSKAKQIFNACGPADLPNVVQL
ncbi:nucleotide sugar dehydrogenase [Streptomyces decoyicus]|uniref:Nucleotide sugar dehydrogenase n=1 Tax=Streptomyces decoyicus TaxID=249567 RepID=A0ABZ1FD05_9ACTN|nr:nucleotide sugar dehydrogenase [Streptomyces decoyicus]WSB68250.1 nucleotide sugar dehydrogenase [Streptomyces decoyicus]